MTTLRRRCAIYTRKSTEAGLEQDFNSLDAQREACLAYIKSQRHEGWEYVPTEYDDGGFSGGTIERPALQRLLADVAKGLVNVIVVYKIDRLTRSLFDFAKIIELLDAHGASFVSVTQQFNTTTSMGRLTLNVLLSFAQFEREVTGERIRDKIAASKKKGMWMGGNPPLGYDIVDRQLVVNEREAQDARTIFSAYLKAETVTKLEEEVSALGLKTKSWTSSSGKVVKGSKFTRGRLYHLLNNPIYIGRIVHKEATYEGQHKAIISEELWSRVQQQLQDQWGVRKVTENRKSPCWLVGILKDENGTPFKSCQTNRNGRLYYYYKAESEDKANEGWSLPAREAESTVVAGLLKVLSDPLRLLELVGTKEVGARSIHLAQEAANKLVSACDGAAGGSPIRPALAEVVVTQSEIKVRVIGEELRKLCGFPKSTAQEDPSYTNVVGFPVRLKRRQIGARVVIQSEQRQHNNRDEKLIRLVARAHVWFEQLKLAERKSVEDIAAAEKLDAGDVSRALPLAFLAPSIVEAILEGKQPPDLTAERLRRLAPLPHSWAEQRRVLGF